MPAIRKCRGCGADVPNNAPFGHCPKCLLDLGFGPLPDEVKASAPTKPDGGRIFGDYELLEQIGRGGMGVVYKARQLKLNRPVALKMISAGEFASPMLIQRFHREAEAAANLHHPNIVPIYETGEINSQHYLSMALIEGMGLDEYIKRAAGVEVGLPGNGARSVSRMRQEDIARLLAKVARAVDYAHQHGVLHRDLKPGNILVDHKSEPHLTDFGLAKVLGRGDSSLTVTGAIMGTPSFMAPEQAAGKGKSITTAADVYSLGAILYAMLTGVPPFRGDTPVETLRQVVEQEPKPPSTLREGIDSDLATIAMKCLEKEPQRRYSSASALAEDLERWSRREPIQARPSSLSHRVSRWIQRNPAPALVILSLCVGLLACLALLQLARKERAAKDRALDDKEHALASKGRALEIVKQGLDKRLDELWLDTNRGAFERITAAELAAYEGSDWSPRPGPVTALVFGVYIYSKPARMLSSLSPLLLQLGNEVASDLDGRVEIEMRIFRSYESALAALEQGEVQFMRVGPSSYLQLESRNAKVELLASQTHRDPLTLAIFTHTNSGIRAIADLRGKSFAFGDTNSTTGNYAAKWLLYKEGLRLSDLERHAHLSSQSEVLELVATNFSAGAANFDLVRKRPELITIATLSLENLGLCWVAAPNLDTVFTRQLRARLLGTKKDASVLVHLESAVTGFQLLEDQAFDELRKIMRQADLFAVPHR